MLVKQVFKHACSTIVRVCMATSEFLTHSFQRDEGSGQAAIDKLSP